MSALGTKRTFRQRLRMSAFGGKADIAFALADKADLAKPCPGAMLVVPVRCAPGGGHETTGIYQPYWWRCGNVAACFACATAGPAGGWVYQPRFLPRIMSHNCQPFS